MATCCRERKKIAVVGSQVLKNLTSRVGEVAAQKLVDGFLGRAVRYKTVAEFCAQIGDPLGCLCTPNWWKCLPTQPRIGHQSVESLDGISRSRTGGAPFL